MVEVTQQDRDAAAGLGCGFCPDDMDLEIAKALAKRAEQAEAQTVAEIVAWLRGRANEMERASEMHPEDAAILYAGSAMRHELADAIEQRAYN